MREGDPALLVGELSFADGTVELATVEAQKAVYSAARVLPAGMERVPVDILDPASENGKYTVLFEPRVDEGLETNRGLARTAYPQAGGVPADDCGIRGHGDADRRAGGRHGREL